MKLTQILALGSLAQAQLDMDAFMAALMSKDPRQVESFKQRLMKLPKMPRKDDKPSVQKKVEEKKKPISKPTSKVEDHRNRFANYRTQQRPTFIQRPPSWATNNNDKKKDKKVIDLTKKTTKAPKVKTTRKPARTTRAPKKKSTEPERQLPTLNRKINASSKVEAPLSAGGRLFGYNSIVHDFQLPNSAPRMALSSKEVFGRKSFGRSGGKATSCFSCQGGTYEECLAAGATESCMADESACFIREYTQTNGVPAVVMGCQNVFQCVDDFNANAPMRQQGFDNMPDVAGLTTRGGYATADQCRPGESGSVCHQCCTQGNNCNQAWVNSQMDSIDEWINFDV